MGTIIVSDGGKRYSNGISKRQAFNTTYQATHELGQRVRLSGIINPRDAGENPVCYPGAVEADERTEAERQADYENASDEDKRKMNEYLEDMCPTGGISPY